MKRAPLTMLIVAAGLAMMAAGTAGHGQAPAPGDLPDGPGKDKVLAACTTCHAITQVTSQLRTTPQWADTVDQMISRGAAVTDDDYPIIVQYLGKNFAPAPKGSPAKPAT